jgi:hypothetical protein
MVPDEVAPARGSRARAGLRPTVTGTGNLSLYCPSPSGQAAEISSAAGGPLAGRDQRVSQGSGPRARAGASHGRLPRPHSESEAESQRLAAWRP